MKRGLIAAVAVLCLPMLAHADHEWRRRPNGELVMVEKEVLQQKLSQVNTAISDAMGRARKSDKRLVTQLKDIRDDLQDMLDYLSTAPEVRQGDWRYADDRERDRDHDRDHDRDRDRDRRVVVVHRYDTPPGQPPQPMPPQPAPNQPPPPPQPVVYPMADAAFGGLMRAIATESFPNDRLRVLQQAAPANWFLVAQVQEILRQFAFPQDRLRAMRALKPRILDTANYYQLYASFEFPNDKQELKRILEQQ
jgi:hypothetical protein